MSKPGIAPCGHPGTYVTSNFITCNQRCGFGDNVKASTGLRREPGHVDMCACAPCQIRRRVRAVVLIGKDGEVVNDFTWNGWEDVITWTPRRASQVRHWELEDVDGDIVARGSAFIDLVPNREAHINIKLFMDAADKVTLAVTQDVAYDTETYKIEPGLYGITITRAELEADKLTWRGKLLDEVRANMNEVVEKFYGDDAASPFLKAMLDYVAEDTVTMYELAGTMFPTPTTSGPLSGRWGNPLLGSK